MASCQVCGSDSVHILCDEHYSGWIPVSEELPKAEGGSIISKFIPVWGTAKYPDEYTKTGWFEGYYRPNLNVFAERTTGTPIEATHWMKIQPPKEQGL